jgi:hypothetical protein
LAEPFKFEIDRSLWYRGNGTSRLKMKDTEQYCCLGLACLTQNYTPAEIEGRQTPASLINAPGLDRFLGPFTFTVEARASGYTAVSSRDATDLMSLNDTVIGSEASFWKKWTGAEPCTSNSTIHTAVIKTEEQREALITEIFAANSIEVTFAN